MRDLNKVQLTGHVGQDPEVRHTENGHVLTRFSVASNRRWKDQDGADAGRNRMVQRRRLGQARRNLRRLFAQRVSHLYLEGRLHTRTYDDPDSGQKRYFTEVIVSEMIMLDRRDDTDADTRADAPSRAPERARTTAASAPWNAAMRASAPTLPTCSKPMTTRAGRSAARPGGATMATAKVYRLPLVRSPLEFGRWYTKATFEQHYGVRQWRDGGALYRRRAHACAVAAMR